MSCDVVVVGSGAGGGTAVGVLAAAGHDVLVLEAGSYLNESDFTHLESDAYARMYLEGDRHLHHRPVRWRPGSRDLDHFMAGVDAAGYGPNQTTYFTFHQMGSARMGSDPAESVVDANNQVHDVSGLYVMDGSCFPTSSGVNPMLSIAAIAHRGANRLAAGLA